MMKLPYSQGDGIVSAVRKATVALLIATAVTGCNSSNDNPAPASTTLSKQPIALGMVFNAGFIPRQIHLEADGSYDVVADYGNCSLTFRIAEGKLTYNPANERLKPVREATFHKLGQLAKSYGLSNCIPHKTSETNL